MRRLVLLAISCLALGAVSANLAWRAGARLENRQTVRAILAGEDQADDLAFDDAPRASGR